MRPITLTTKHLTLRRANHEDPENLFRHYYSNINSTTYLTRNPHDHVNQTKQLLQDRCHTPWDVPGNKFSWVIALTSTNESIGIFHVEQQDDRSVQIHYGISSQFSNQGFVTEASHVVIQWLTIHHVKKIWAVCHPSNHASIRVLEKLNFQKMDALTKKLIFPLLDNNPIDCPLYQLQQTT